MHETWASHVPNADDDVTMPILETEDVTAKTGLGFR